MKKIIKTISIILFVVLIAGLLGGGYVFLRDSLLSNDDKPLPLEGIEIEESFKENYLSNMLSLGEPELEELIAGEAADGYNNALYYSRGYVNEYLPSNPTMLTDSPTLAIFTSGMASEFHDGGFSASLFQSLDDTDLAEDNYLILTWENGMYDKNGSFVGDYVGIYAIESVDNGAVFTRYYFYLKAPFDGRIDLYVYLAHEKRLIKSHLSFAYFDSIDDYE